MYSPFDTICVGIGERKFSSTFSSAGVTFVSCSTLNHESTSRESGAHFDMCPSWNGILETDRCNNPSRWPLLSDGKRSQCAAGQRVPKQRRREIARGRKGQLHQTHGDAVGAAQCVGTAADLSTRMPPKVLPKNGYKPFVKPAVRQARPKRGERARSARGPR